MKRRGASCNFRLPLGEAERRRRFNTLVSIDAKSRAAAEALKCSFQMKSGDFLRKCLPVKLRDDEMGQISSSGSRKQLPVRRLTLRRDLEINDDNSCWESNCLCAVLKQFISRGSLQIGRLLISADVLIELYRLFPNHFARF